MDQASIDDEDGNPNPQVASHAKEFGTDVSGGGGGGGYGDEEKDDNYNMQLNLFTCKEHFTHATQNEDYGCRVTVGPGIGQLGNNLKIGVRGKED